MLNIITRASKGFPLTNAEMDQNLDSLRNAVDTKAESVHGHNIQDVTNLQSILDTKAASDHVHSEATVSVAGLMSSTDKNKLDGIAAGATVNSSDSALRDRSAHTGVQGMATISGLADALDAKVDISTVGFANGVASLDANGKVPISQIPITPSAVDSVAGKTGVVTLVPADITGLDAALASKADNNVTLTDAAATATLPATAAASVASRLQALRNNVKQAFADLAGKAADSAVVKLTGAQTVAGGKTFSSRSSHAGAYTPSLTPAHSATPTFDCSLGNVFEPATMTGNVTSITLSNAVAGQTVQIRFQQDGSGGRTCAVPSGAKVDGNINTGANRVSWLILTYSSRGARWEGNWQVIPS